MFLIKYCKSEHNPKNGNRKLLLNSLDYFKNLDHEFLGDPNEGRMQTSISLDIGESLNSNTAESIFSNSGVIASGIGKELQIVGGNISVTRQFPNCLIFCCRLEPEFPSKTQVSFISEDYDDWYQIGNAEEFRQHLLKSMARDVEKTDLSRLIGSGCLLQSAYGPVSYSDNFEYTLTSQASREIESLEKNFRNSIFTKETKYSEQREFRFVFFGTQNGNIISLPLERLFVEV